MHILAFILIFVVGSIIAACDGDYSGIAAIGKFVGFFVLLFAVLWLFMVSYKRSFQFYRGVRRCDMPKSSNQKLKLIYLMKILLERTDETHSITMPEIIDALAAYDISAECKTGKNREPSMLSTVPDVLPTNFEICSLLGLIYCLRLMRV